MRGTVHDRNGVRATRTSILLTSQLFLSDNVLLAPLVSDLQHPWKGSQLIVDVAEMKISTSKSEAVVLSRKLED